MGEKLYFSEDIEILRQVQPYIFYRRIQFDGVFHAYHVLEKIDGGFNYLLHKVRYKNTRSWQSWHAHASEYYPADVKIELMDEASSVKLSDPIELRSIATPGDEDVQYSALSGNINLSAIPIKNEMTFNRLYRYGSTIHFELTGHYYDPLTGWHPKYMDFMMIGYYVPDSQLRLWGIN